MLFDTTFVIDLAEETRGRRFGPCQALLHGHRHTTRRVSVVSLGEFAVGATEAETRRAFRGFVPLPLGREGAVFAGRLQAALPCEMGENDLWIAAEALRARLPLVTRDRAFSRVPGLRVIGY